MTTFTTDEVLARLKQAVKVAGEDTTRSCFYALYKNPEDPSGEPVDYDVLIDVSRHSGEDIDVEPVAPHCIVGVVLTDLGLPIKSLVKWENSSVTGIYADRRLLPFEIEPDGWEALAAAQTVQDEKGQWGDAVAQAEGLVEALRGRDEFGEYKGSYVYRTMTKGRK